MTNNIEQLLSKHDLTDLADVEDCGQYILLRYNVNKVNLELAKKLVSFRLELTNNTDTHFIIDASKLNTVDKDASFYFDNEGSDKLLTSAIVLSNMKSMFYNVIYFFINPKVECKAFTTVEQAEKWLLNKIESEQKAAV